MYKPDDDFWRIPPRRLGLDPPRYTWRALGWILLALSGINFLIWQVLK